MNPSLPDGVSPSALKVGSQSHIFLFYFLRVMHWLHVYPNSDSSTFRHFFGKFLEEFWQILCSYLADILPENTKKFGFCHFLADILHLGDFQHFLGKSMERKKELADFGNLVFIFLLNFETKFVGKLDENQPKKCRKVEKSEFGFTCSQCIILKAQERKPKARQFRVVLHVADVLPLFITFQLCAMQTKFACITNFRKRVIAQHFSPYRVTSSHHFSPSQKRQRV